MTSSGFVVLVVEDDVLIRIDVAGAFEASGWAVLEAGSSRAALEFCGADTPVDALITDINLADGATGWDVAWAFWRRDAIPVIYTSASSDLPDRRVPQSRFLAKPCLSSALVEDCVHLHARFRQDRMRRWPMESSRNPA